MTLNVVDIDLHLGQELTVSLLSLTPFIFPIIFPIISYAIAENISCMLIVRGFMCGSSATDVCICVMPSVRNHTIYSRIVLLLMSYFLRSIVVVDFLSDSLRFCPWYNSKTNIYKL